MRCEENIIEIIKRYFNSNNEVSCYKFWVDYNLELLYFINVF